MSRSLAASLLVAAALAAACCATPSRAAEALPEASAVLAKYIQAVGGPAFDTLRTSVTHLTLSIPAGSFSIDITQYRARPNKDFTEAQSQATGRILSGCDGTRAWEMNSMQGPRLKQGAELATALRDATFEGLVSWRRLYKSAVTAGADTVAGAPCVKVVLTPAEGQPRIVSFDLKTGLVARIETSVPSPSGDVLTVSDLGDWRPEGPVMVAHRIEGQIAGQRRVTTIQGTTFNVNLPADRFDPPAEVKALIK